MKNLSSNNKIAVNSHLAKFKERGIIAFDKILSISQSDRIPELVKSENGRAEVLTALSAALTSAFNNMNLKFGVNADQTIELADQIIDQSHEDNLAIEDVLLFLQKLLVGECGKLYDRMDMPLFFEKFEVYRQERHSSLVNIRDEQHTQSKIMGRGEERETTADERKMAQDILDMAQSMQVKDDER